MVDDDNNGTWIITSTAEGAKEGHIGHKVKALLHPQKRSKTTGVLSVIENALVDAITLSPLSPSYFFHFPHYLLDFYRCMWETRGRHTVPVSQSRHGSGWLDRCLDSDKGRHLLVFRLFS